MFGSINTHNATAQNKENAVLGSVARTGKTGLLNGKSGSALHPSKTTGMSQKTFGSPRPSTILTPSSKKATNKTLTRLGLRSQEQPISNKPRQHPLSVVQEQAPKTIKRRQGLFNTRSQSRIDDSSHLLEPEYVPPRPVSPAFDAEGLFGCDLKVSLVPVTQLSNYGARLRELPPLELNLEALVDIPVSPPAKRRKTSIPTPSLMPGIDFISCKPEPLVANLLMPSRIPQLKRKRHL
ncbi:hypothetical protein H4R99_006082 [Coemansia sp. RSA 1722]|nr:hypothetical protein LPJ57_000391 [Coemansia sp. RSA 486]KAJ2228486.1 hypothetical protein IWW45_006589 [Coemansia sp. RSA 485]KAJ2593470.1 hypothetical protein H4R99_006082 [Coemansia sp. RSA 1722]KAJ2601038.1 hypothetical protein GGF39_001458 [Coemansia sp. RSA 1721]KAJ2640304.1 hypothetical protein GGF40_000203 [Coemansia sp. RSA 1286]